MSISTFGRRVVAATLVTAGLALAPIVSATTYTNIYNFGDSLSDSGNISFALGGAFPPPPYTPGRFTSNFTDGTPGRTWVEVAADQLGLSAEHSLIGGTNYAWGGARTGPVNAGFPPSLLDQTLMYLDDAGGVADPNALYSVFGGGNDVRDAVTADSVANISSIITQLAGAGAVNFFVPNLPNIGLTPEALAGEAPGGSSALLSQLSIDFNFALRDELKLLEETLGVNIIEFDIFTVFNNIIANPGDFGFSNVTDRCFDEGAGTLCSDPDAYLFFDGIHPTAAAHQLLGNLAFKTIEASKIPVPAALPLLLSALGMFGFARKKAA